MTKQRMSGAIFVAIGVLGAILSRNYELGTATRMGPGYFPFVLSVLIALGSQAGAQSVPNSASKQVPMPVPAPHSKARAAGTARTIPTTTPTLHTGTVAARVNNLRMGPDGLNARPLGDTWLDS